MLNHKLCRDQKSLFLFLIGYISEHFAFRMLLRLGISCYITVTTTDKSSGQKATLEQTERASKSIRFMIAEY